MGKRSIIPETLIISKIYYIRGQKVMLDMDLAELYGVETKRLNEQVRRNPERFPAHFMFELTKAEAENLRSHFATSSSLQDMEGWGGRRTYPYAFTEHGVLMLSNVLKSGRAVEMSIRIIDVFVKMREMLTAQKDILLKIEKLEKEVTRNSSDVQAIFQVLKQMLRQPQKPREPIGFKLGNKKPR